MLGLNPLKRVNSILTHCSLGYGVHYRLNPLKRVNSILTGNVIEIAPDNYECLNPLKRVNSILTLSTVYYSR